MNMRGSLFACSAGLGAERWMLVGVMVVRWNLDMVMFGRKIGIAYDWSRKLCVPMQGFEMGDFMRPSIRREDWKC